MPATKTKRGNRSRTVTYRRAAKFMWEAHSTGQAVVKSCHRELAELNQERLQQKRLSVSIEPGG